MSRSPGIASIVALCALFSMASTVALAEDGEEHIGSDHNQIDGVRMDVHADIGSYGAFGLGLRADIPILKNGILNNVNDELAISPGVEVFFVNFWRDRYDGGPYVMPLALLQWNFYLGEHWSVFPELGVAVYLGDSDLPRGRGFYAGVATGLGARYHFNDRNALLLRAGWPAGLQVGMTF